MNERFLALRLALGLSQEAIATRIGLSKSGISNIENGKRSLIGRNIKLLCTEFNVTETWLRTGEGKMFRDDAASVLGDLATEFRLDELDRRIVDQYIRLPDAHRKIIKSFILSLVGAEDPIEVELENYRRELEAEAAGETSSASVDGGAKTASG